MKKLYQIALRIIVWAVLILAFFSNTSGATGDILFRIGVLMLLVVYVYAEPIGRFVQRRFSKQQPPDQPVYHLDTNKSGIILYGTPRSHTIPLGALVEIVSEGIRLFVVEHTRDCDGTPLYNLSFDKELIGKNVTDTYRLRNTSDDELLRFSLSWYDRGKVDSGYSKDSLKVITLPNATVSTPHINASSTTTEGVINTQGTN